MVSAATIKGIQDIMRKDVGINGDAQRIEQLVWMIFLKILDDRERESELLSDKYRSPIPEPLRWRNWAADPEGITGEALLEFVNNELFKRLKALPASRPNTLAFVVKSVFEDANNFMKSGTLLRQVINKIQSDLDFNSSEDRHAFNDLYETILKDLQSAGNAGEFYTPRGVTQFVVDMVDPKLGEQILDPACGTGGFLQCAVDHVRSNYVKSVDDEKKLQESIIGVEKKQLPHLLCVTNMMLHGIEVPYRIRHDNTLARPLRDYGKNQLVDVVITNPPFGGIEEDGIESNFPKALQTRETADLFLVLIMQILKPGGRAAVVLPDGSTLSGDGVRARIKERFLEECNLTTVVRLPAKVFAPYTDTKTNILFFTKGEPTTETWYYEHPYPDGQKSYSKTKPIRVGEFDPLKEWWTDRRESVRAWKVSIENIRSSGYNLDVRNPSVQIGTGHDPDGMLSGYQSLLAQIEVCKAALRDQLDLCLRARR